MRTDLPCVCVCVCVFLVAMAADARSMTFLYPSPARGGSYRWLAEGEGLNNRFYDLSDEHLEGWMNQSARVAQGCISINQPFAPGSLPDADSLVYSDAASDSCSPAASETVFRILAEGKKNQKKQM